MLRKFLQSFIKNIIECFRGFNIFWHFLAIALTYIIVTSGFDWLYFKSTRNILLQKITLAPALIGFAVPILLPFIIYCIGKYKNDMRSKIVATGVAQAGIIGYLLSIFYKTFTGRTQPAFFTQSLGLDISHDFHFGILQHGVFWGWPSSHTMVAFAMSFALITFYPKNKKVFWIALIYALFIGLGVSISIHWFSDFVAGAILGGLVGVVVGRNFFTFA